MTPPPASPDWIDPAVAAARLGVKVDALSAYIARGMIGRRDDGAVSAGGVARLLRARRPATIAASAAEPAVQAFGGPALPIRTALIEARDGVMRHRGLDAVVLAESATLEDAARLLWAALADPFCGLKPRPVAMLGADPRARALSFLAARAALELPIGGRTDAALACEAGALLTDLADTLCGASRIGALHERLAKTWRLEGARADAIRQALVLCVDEPVDAATLAVRAAASSGAALASALLAGTAVIGGPGDVGETLQAGLFLIDAKRLGDPRVAVKQRLELNLPLPGFAAGPVDPRAKALALALPWPEDVRELANVAEGLGGRPYTMDFALAALGRTLGLPGDAGMTLRLLGRATGWLGHALEQHRTGEAFRFSTIYVGEDAGSALGAPPAPCADAA